MQEVLRCERKYLLNAVEFLKKSHVLQKLLREDPHNGAEGYLVRSLYFDTEYDGDLFDKEYGMEVRRKLRLRTYDPNSGAALLELKQKQGERQKKRSLWMRREDARRLTACDYTPLRNYSEPFAAECYAFMNTRCYRPRTVIQYRRMAFFVNENNTRITFDRQIDATAASFDLFSPDLPMAPVMDRSLVVLEVKYDRFLLSYIKELLSSLEKDRLSVSKYGMARQIAYHASL